MNRDRSTPPSHLRRDDADAGSPSGPTAGAGGGRVPLAPGVPEISTQLYVILTGLVEDRVGLHYGPADRPVFAAKVWARAVDAGFESLMDYYYYLRYDDPEGAELDALTEALVVNETYLLREPAGLQAAVDEVVALGRPARIWCGACSTGEEPLTLAMLLADRGALDDVHIVASDVSDWALARARSGRLGPRSARRALPPALQRWVVRDERGERVEPALVRAIDWRRVNLIEGEAVRALAQGGPFDVVVLRNVLIYFSDDTTRQVLANVSATMTPGGMLVVGASESLLRLGTDLRLEQRNGAFYYRKGDP